MEQNKTIKYLMYCRKSTDAEDRQVYSTEDQQNELLKIVDHKKLEVVQVFAEAKSAKKPGRPIYNQMIQMIKNGEADGILCWKLNRLARNPVDGGEIQWLLQQDIIKSIITPGREYLPTDNVLMMAVELGMANQFILDLSQDVKRGMYSKVEKGWRPGIAALGYLNDKYGDKGNKKILVDDERFDLVQKMWHMLLSGTYTVSQIHKTAKDKWGLTTRKGTKLRLSHAYAIFSNSFYSGEFEYNGEVYQGKHKPMIKPEQFDLAQTILGRKGKPRSKHKRLPFTGLIECGECGGMIVADEKIKSLKSTGEIKKYIYHRCSKRKKNTTCDQKQITYDDMIEQIESYLDTITIPKSFVLWAINILEQQNEVEAQQRDTIIKNLDTEYERVIKQIDNLMNIYISSENADKELLNDSEFKTQKNKLTKEKNRIEDERRNIESRVEHWLDVTEKTFQFAAGAHEAFEKGNFETKTNILRALGHKFSLTNKKLSIELREPFLVFQKYKKAAPLGCEPNTALELADKQAIGEYLSG